MKPDENIGPWKASQAFIRIDACRVMLSIHGFLTEAEERKVKQRIDRWIKKHGFKAERSPIAKVGIE